MSDILGKQVLRYVNIERTKRRLYALNWSESLFELSQIRVKEIQSHYSHTRPDGNPFYTISKSREAKSENIASGQSCAKLVVDAWMKSKGHRENILEPRAKFMATSFLHGRWVQLFG
jgi:uncharacterized protein YkwD